MFNKIIINMPQCLNITIWKKKCEKKYINIWIQNKSKELKFFLNCEESLMKFDKNTNSVIIEKKWLNQSNNKFSNFLKKFLKSWDIYFFNKIKFKGKGFRIRFLKKNKLVKFFFGRSHKTFIFFKKIILKKISKYKFILKNIDLSKLIINSNIATKIKPMNLYTLRGIRKTRQIIYKRKGKKGTYI